MNRGRGSAGTPDLRAPAEPAAAGREVSGGAAVPPGGQWDRGRQRQKVAHKGQGPPEIGGPIDRCAPALHWLGVCTSSAGWGAHLGAAKPRALRAVRGQHAPRSWTPAPRARSRRRQLERDALGQADGPAIAT